MKRFALVLSTLIILTAALLSRSALDPGRFTGTWYDAQTGEGYLFREGIIQKPEEEVLRGAYSFTRSSITLFLTEREGLDTVQTLRWQSGKDGEVLCTEAGEIRFRRRP